MDRITNEHVAAAEDDALAAGLAQADCTVMGIAELDSVGYYVLKGTHKSAAGRSEASGKVKNLAKGLLAPSADRLENSPVFGGDTFGASG